MNVLYNVIKDIKDSQRNEYNRTKLNITGFKEPMVRGQTGRHGSNILPEPVSSVSKLSKCQSWGRKSGLTSDNTTS